MKFLPLLCLTVFLSGISAAPFSKRSIPLPPSQDPFYVPAAGYESFAVGTILDSRKMTNLFGTIVIPDKIASAYQFLVRSEDTWGNPNAIVTTVFIPVGGDPNKLLSYQIEEDSSSFQNCQPSYSMQIGADIKSIASAQFEEILIQAGINQGWYVVVPDYEGPKSAFGCGHQAGKATLNSVRAALNSGNITGISKDAKVAYWGYSGGSIATGWAALLEPTYAPELASNTIGYAYGGIVADVAHTAAKNVGSLFSGLIFAAINGLSVEYDQLNPFLEANVFPDKMTKFRSPQDQCLLPTLVDFAFASWSDYFKEGANTLYDPVVVNITSQNNMVTSELVPTAPLFFFNTVIDEIIPASDADDLYGRLCSAGVNIDYNQDLIGEHAITQFTGLGVAFSWLKDRFNGVPVKKGCSKSYSVSTALTLPGVLGLSDEAGSIISTLFYDALNLPAELTSLLS